MHPGSLDRLFVYAGGSRFPVKAEVRPELEDDHYPRSQGHLRSHFVSRPFLLTQRGLRDGGRPEILEYHQRRG